MKSLCKRLTAGVLSVMMLSLNVVPVLAFTEQGSGSSSSSSGSNYTPPTSSGGSGSTVIVEPSDDDSSGSGSGMDISEGTIIIGCDCDCETYEQYSVFHPKVTALRNANAMCVDIDGEDVYYIPTMDELPFDLGELVTDITDTNGKRHQFALVYDKYFDAEANARNLYYDKHGNGTVAQGENVSPSYAEIHTSKNIAASKYNDPALESIGYDLLLTKEDITMDVDNANVNVKYKATKAESKSLDAKQAAMDIYKALGVIEYTVRIAFGKDDEFDINKSPILQEVDFQTMLDDAHGVDASEVVTYVGVTRTNPDLYWERLIQDGVTTGLQESDRENLSTIYHLGTPITEDKPITAAQFCNMMVALMNLYGEAALTSEEIEQFERVHGSLLLGNPVLNDTELRSIEYLVCKGIIDAQTVNNVRWDEPISLLKSSDDDYNAIISWLGRLKDPNIRLAMPEPEKIDPQLEEAGYSAAEITVPNIIDYTEMSETHKTSTYDWLVEYEPITPTDDGKNVVLVKYKPKGVAELKADPVKTKSMVKAANDESVFEDTNNVILKGLKQLDHVDDQYGANNYFYLGTEEHDGRYFYHFRTSNKVTNVTLYWSNPDSKAKDDSDSERLVRVVMRYDEDGSSVNIEPAKKHPDSQKLQKVTSEQGGGIFYLNDDSGDMTYSSFSQAGFDSSYICGEDEAENALSYAPMSADNTVIQFYLSEARFNKFCDKLYTLDDNISWIDVITDFKNGGKKSVVDAKVQTNNKAVNMSVAIRPTVGKSTKSGSAISTTYYLFEIITNNPKWVKKNTVLLTKKNKQKKLGVSVKENRTGYIRYNSSKTGSADLMLSVDYLKEQGLLASFKAVSKDLFIICTTEFNSNVVINNENHSVIVGDTIYGYEKDENRPTDPLVVQVQGDYYINYRACLGWCGDAGFIRDGNGVIAISRIQGVKSTAIKTTNSLLAVNSFYPGAVSHTKYSSYEYANKKIVEGIALTGTYVLAPYMLVHNQEIGNADLLFVWHINKMRTIKVGSDGAVTAKCSSKDDKKAREEFAKYTGVDVSNVGSEYFLRCYLLSKKSKKMGKASSDSLPGFYYVSQKISSRFDNATVSAGWVYDPVEVSNMTEGLNDYVLSSTAEQKDVTVPIPIVEYDHQCYDVNINGCKESGNNKYYSVGTMPGTYLDANQQKLIKITKDAKYKDKTVDATSFEVTTAPAGMFAQIKSLGSVPLKEIVSGTVYYGTSKCTLSNDKLTFADKKTTLDMSAEATCTYLGTGASTTFVVIQNNGAIGDLLNALEVQLEYVMNDPDNLVDWGQYTFKRLIQNLDAWSTVALIFVLNILPRVGMLLFFVLIMLSLIKDVKFWQKFCHNVFDVYKLISMGHQTVDTIDMKRMVIVSCACLAIFAVIMDGQLFNLIIFISKFIIAGYQH